MDHYSCFDNLHYWSTVGFEYTWRVFISISSKRKKCTKTGFCYTRKKYFNAQRLYPVMGPRTPLQLVVYQVVGYYVTRESASCGIL